MTYSNRSKKLEVVTVSLMDNDVLQIVYKNKNNTIFMKYVKLTAGAKDKRSA